MLLCPLKLKSRKIFKKTPATLTFHSTSTVILSSFWRPRELKLLSASSILETN